MCPENWVPINMVWGYFVSWQIKKNYIRFQVLGVNKSKTGNNSSLPASISKIKTHFEKALNWEKLPIGPTSSSPGPTLLKVVATAVKVVTRSNSFILTRRTDSAKMKI